MQSLMGTKTITTEIKQAMNPFDNLRWMLVYVTLFWVAVLAYLVLR